MALGVVGAQRELLVDGSQQQHHVGAHAQPGVDGVELLLVDLLEPRRQPRRPLGEPHVAQVVPAVDLEDGEPLALLGLGQRRPRLVGVARSHRLLRRLDEQALHLERAVAVVRGRGPAAAQLGDGHLGARRDVVRDTPREELLEGLAQQLELCATAGDRLLEDVGDLLLGRLARRDEGAAQDDGQQLAVGPVDGDDGGKERGLPSRLVPSVKSCRQFTALAMR